MIPLTSTMTTTYSPPSFNNLAPKPVFRFRAATPLSRMRYRAALMDEGLRFFDMDEFQAEVMRALKELWAGDDAILLSNETRLRAHWETLKQAQADPTVEIDPAEAEAVNQVQLRLIDAWPMLRRMNADNFMFNSLAPKIALAMFVCGWSGVDVPFRMEDGRVPIDLLDALEAAIDEIEEQAQTEQVVGVTGVAMMELSLHALSLMGLVADAEKNLPSPSSLSGIQDGSATDGGSSPAASATISSPPVKLRTQPKKPANS